jgi:hypothetical protein
MLDRHVLAGRGVQDINREFGHDSAARCTSRVERIGQRDGDADPILLTAVVDRVAGMRCLIFALSRANDLFFRANELFFIAGETGQR